MKLQPLDERVLVEPIEEEVQKGTILIPDTAKEKPIMGKVKAVGNDIVDPKNEKRVPLSELVKVGDLVIFDKYSGQEVRIEGIKHLLIERTHILAKVEGLKR